MKNFLFGIITLAMIVLTGISANSPEPWSLKKQKDGIEVYTRNEPGSVYDSFKAVMIVDAKIDNIMDVLRDVEKYPEWFAFTASAYILDQSDNMQKIYMETDYPWPFKNEYMHYLMTFIQVSKKVVKINIQGFIGESAKTKGICPLKKADGYIMLSSFNDDIPKKEKTKIVYYFHSEPSQDIATWLINPSIHEMPYRTFLSLRKLLFLKRR